MDELKIKSKKLQLLLLYLENVDDYLEYGDVFEQFEESFPGHYAFLSEKYEPNFWKTVLLTHGCLFGH